MNTPAAGEFLSQMPKMLVLVLCVSVGVHACMQGDSQIWHLVAELVVKLVAEYGALAPCTQVKLSVLLIKLPDQKILHQKMSMFDALTVALPGLKKRNNGKGFVTK